MAPVDETSIDEAGFRMSEATAGDFFALLKPRVLLVDLRWAYGSVASCLRMRAHPTVRDAAFGLQDGAPPASLATFASVHDTGLFVLPSTSPANAAVPSWPIPS